MTDHDHDAIQAQEDLRLRFARAPERQELFSRLADELLAARAAKHPRARTRTNEIPPSDDVPDPAKSEHDAVVAELVKRLSQRDN